MKDATTVTIEQTLLHLRLLLLAVEINLHLLSFTISCIHITVTVYHLASNDLVELKLKLKASKANSNVC